MCVKPPSKLILIQKLLKYLEDLKIPSGIDLRKQNFPDKAWLVLAIATVSGGKDEIFHRDYLPSNNLLRPNAQQPVLPVDPAFQKIPLHLQASGRGRHLKIGGLTKEDKIAEQIKQNQIRMEK